MKRDVLHNHIYMIRENNIKYVLGSVNPSFTSSFHTADLRKEKKTNSDVYSAPPTTDQSLSYILDVPFHLVERGCYN